MMMIAMGCLTYSVVNTIYTFETVHLQHQQQHKRLLYGGSAMGVQRAVTLCAGSGTCWHFTATMPPVGITQHPQQLAIPAC